VKKPHKIMNPCRVFSNKQLSHNIANMSSSDDERSSKHLSEQERLEITRKLSRPNLPSKCSLAHEYNFNDKCVRRLWNQ